MDTTPDRPATDVRSVAREAWRTRPARRRSDERVAGVGGAIARRYAIDPTLVRVALVVLLLSGSGLLLYLVGCLVLPADPADPPRRAGRVRPGGSGAPVLLIVATAVVGLGTLGGWGDGWLASLASLALAGVALYGLQTHRGDRALAATGAPRAAAGPSDTASGAPSDAPPDAPADAPTTGPAGSREPPTWDPLGAAPFAWDLPSPAPAGPAERPSRFTPVVLGLALLAAGVVGVLALAGVPGLGITAVWAAALAVVGLGLLVGAFRRRGRWLIAAAVPLALVTLVSALGPPGSGPGVGRGFGPAGAFGVTAPAGTVGERGAGDIDVVPADAASVAPVYRTGLGDVDVDLRRVTATPGGPVRLTVQSGAGDPTVTVPATADVRVDCRSGLGDVSCLGRSGDVAGLVDPGPDGPGGPAFDLTVLSGAGDVAVRRG